MRSGFLLLIFVFALTESYSQSKNDCLGRQDYYIVKSAADQKSMPQIKANDIKTKKVVRQLYGKSYGMTKRFGEISKAYYYNFVFKDGLQLMLPEDTRCDVDFHILSPDYTLVFGNGQRARVGMKSEQIKILFPDQFAHMQPLEQKGKEGRLGFRVYFCRILKGKEVKEDAWINFEVNGKTGVLEEFYTYTPG
jgi:hypothetical protein